MNNGNQPQNEKLEKLLAKVRLSEPSPELKERVFTKAAKVWNQTSVELSWKIPAKRLVASAAAAVFVVWLAHISSDCSMTRWQTNDFSATSQQPSELDVLPDLPYAPYVKYLTSISRELLPANTLGLRHYVETVRQLLDEATQNEVSKPPDPTEGRSRLLPDRSGLSSYS